MELIHKKTLEQAIKMLDAIGVAYAIKDTDGNMHGTLETKRSHSRPLRYAFGSVAKHIHQYLDNLGVGAIAYIPCDGFDHKTISSNAAALMIHKHGKGSYKSAYNKEENVLEIIRFS